MGDDDEFKTLDVLVGVAVGLLVMFTASAVGLFVVLVIY